MKFVRLLFSFNGTIDRTAYVGVALAGVLIKHVVDLIIAAAFGRPWDFLNYLMPLGVPARLDHLGPADIRFLATMLAAALPFAWVGLAITAKRFRTVGWPSWLVVLFFVPIANIASFAIAAAWPEHETTREREASSRISRFVPASRFGSAMFALCVTVLLGAVLVPAGTMLLNSYGWGLFAAVPFLQGAIAAYVYALNGDRTLGESLGVALLSILITAFALLAFALEGGICILMATPLALVFAAMGAIFGHAIGKRSQHVTAAMIVTCVLLAPAIMGAESLSNRVAPTYLATTSIEIDAPPDVVWRNVVSFPDLPPPTELPFRAGVAYPVRAKIVGRGVGAVRYCEFSTGSFVEPITVWEPQHRLAFSVTRSAEPMREWSPYGHLDTPHLHNYMVSRRGQFVLEALPGGRTRLTGTTWYQHHLWPASYWALWSNIIVHDVHYRVLNHIKTISEKRQT